MDPISSIFTLMVAFAVTGLFGIILLPILRKLHLEQTIKEIGPKWHQAKNGTPTMGGLLFIIGIIIGAAAGYLLYISRRFSGGLGYTMTQDAAFFIGLLMAVGFGLIGFIDDYIKIVRHRNLGLTAMQKTIFQLIIATAYLLSIGLSQGFSTIVVFPFLGQVDFGWLYYPMMIIGIYFIVNAVNLTDGVDGLASSVTAVYGIIFMIISSVLMNPALHLLAAALTGGCLGFLIWNFHPAKTFMGDTGSLFLGGVVIALAFGSGLPVLILFAGIIYIVEAISVVLQVISFQTTGKRIFKMSPIHHHFEMSGWSEVKIVIVFSVITALFGAGAIICVCFGI